MLHPNSLFYIKTPDLFKEEASWWNSLGLVSHEPQILVYFTSLRRAVSLV